MKNSFKDLTLEEQIAKRDELRKQYLDIRMDRVLGHVENPLAIRTVKRQIARLNTLIHENALGIRTSAN
ncbi:MAG: 50S ribosomal protein L29 [Sphaerochaetaceae bacterium]|jgi:large subunit ribosomal protein L29|nr:50S ribosomal protein L29 [Sphaerochaetaceae bacterium]